MDTLQTLKELGLTTAESRCYIALQSLGETSGRQLSIAMNAKRTTAYSLLESLVVKGFAEVHIQKKKRIYKTTEPREVALQIEKKLDHFLQLIPWLQSLRASTGETGGIRFFETRKELERFYLTLLQQYKNKSYRIIGTERDWSRLSPSFLKEVHHLLKDLHIHTRMIFSSDTPKISTKETKTALREVKYLPKQYAFRSTIDIFDDRILIVSPELQSVAVLISIPAMRDVFDAVFQILWDKVAK